jgi:hypothetical protein
MVKGSWFMVNGSWFMVEGSGVWLTKWMKSEEEAEEGLLVMIATVEPASVRAAASIRQPKRSPSMPTEPVA